ncbi:hypothetical protein GCQ56_00610 [Marinifilum sp. N1E240]|nr:LamG-like jellyroll fold domain-containing protein [uncultured Marinifilum sp.]MPQ45493.1 hypothetical protein [Marinifilum sp. N1E240]
MEIPFTLPFWNKRKHIKQITMLSFQVLNIKGALPGKIISLALCLILLGSVKAKAQNRPQWITSRPINTMYYIGIGSASKSETDYMKIAKQKALSDLISEIEVKVASNSLLNSLDDNGNISSYFQENIKIEAKRTIEDYQLVESWEGDSEYWVYYQLNKYSYQEKERIRIENMQDKAYDYLQKGNAGKNSGEVSASIYNYLEGLKLIQADLNKNLPYQKNGQTIYLGNELYAGLNNVFTGVQIKADPSSVKGQAFQAVKDQIQIRVSRGMQVLANLPLHVEFISGSGELNHGLITNESGIAHLQVLNISSKQKQQLVLIKPDLKKLCSDRKNKLLHGILNQLKSLPETQVSISLESATIKAFLKQSQDGNSALVKSVKRILSNNYFNFVPSESLADVVVELDEEFKKGGKVNGEMYNMQEYFSSLSLQITNRYSKETVFSYGVNDLRTLAPESTSPKTARMSASRSIMKKMQRKLIQELKKLQMIIDKSIVVPEVVPNVQRTEPSRSQTTSTQSPKTIVTSGLLAYYTFNDGTGRNSTGINNYNALVEGENAPLCVTSTLTGEGKAAQFSGNSYLSIPEHPIQQWTAYSISTWVKTTSGGAVLGRKGSGPTILGTTIQNQLFYQKNHYGRYDTFSFDTDKMLLDSQWHMLTLTVEVLQNGSRSRLFVDGQMVLVENTQLNDKIKGGEGAYIGYDPGSKRYFTGEIDNLRIYNRKLRDEEIQQLYRSQQ